MNPSDPDSGSKEGTDREIGAIRLLNRVAEPRSTAFIVALA
jgi:hypothetical protein